MILLFVAQAAHAERVLPLDRHSDELWLGTHTDLLEDKTGSLTFGAVQVSGNFTEQHDAVPRFLLTRSAMWGRVTLQNKDTVQLTRYIVVNDPVLQEIDIYIQSERERLRHLRSGSLRPDRTLDVDTHLPVIKLQLGPGERITLWTRIKTVYPSSMPLQLVKKASFKREQTYAAIAHGIFIGMSVAMAAYNLFIYFALRTRQNIYFVAFIICNAINASYLNGNMSHHIAPNEIALHTLTYMLSYSFLMIFGALFLAEAGSGKLARELRLLKALIYISVFASLAALSGFHHLWVYITLISGFIAGPVVLAAFMKHIDKRDVAGLVTGAAFTIIILGQSMFIMQISGLLPYNFLTFHAIELAGILQMITLPLGLSLRIKQTYDENIKIRNDLIRHQKEANEILSKNSENLQIEYNTRTHSIAAAHQFSHFQQSMHSLSTLSAGMAHEINNPNNFVCVGAQNLASTCTAFEEFLDELMNASAEDEHKNKIKAHIHSLSEHAHTLHEESELVKKAIDSLSEINQLNQSEKKPYNPATGIREIFQLVEPIHSDQITFTYSESGSSHLLCRPADINQAFLGILNNAIVAVEKNPVGARIDITVEATDHQATLRVRDNGNGMSAETAAAACTPFFTTRQQEGASGLGLSIARDVALAHHGSLTIDSKIGEGTCITMTVAASD